MPRYPLPLRTFAVLAAAGLLACRGGNEDRARADATAVADRFLAAVEAQRWDSAAAVVDSMEAQHFREQRLMILAGLAEHEREITRAMSRTGSGGLASVGGELPLDTALIARHRAWPVRGLEGNPTLGEIAALPARKFYARMYESPVSCWSLPELRGRRMIGAVVDHDSAGYVVYQTIGDRRGVEVEHYQPAVLALARRDGRWTVRPGRLEPQLDVIAILDTSTATRAMMASECSPKGR